MLFATATDCVTRLGEARERGRLAALATASRLGALMGADPRRAVSRLPEWWRCRTRYGTTRRRGTLTCAFSYV